MATTKLRRGVWFQVSAIVLALLSLSSLGCMKQPQQASGDLVGDYAITGTLVENSCGNSALPTKNPLSFVAEIRNDDGVITWQIEKQAPFTGVLRADGAYKFVSEQAMDLGTQVARKKDLEASDFNNLNPDFDLQRSHCALIMKESVSGTLRRMLGPDGGAPDQTDAGGTGADLSGDNIISVEAAAGADCSLQLAINGGQFLTLPCAAQYSMEGALQLADDDKNDKN
jgi:hypothetical protein